MINKQQSSPEPPKWIQDFVKHVIPTMNVVEISPPIGCHYYFNSVNFQWEITIFAAKTEIIGGSLDGKINGTCFGVDLIPLQSLFHKIEEFHWQTHPVKHDDELGNHISVMGMLGSQSIWLRICAEAPQRFPTGRYLRVDQETIEDIW